MNDQRMSMELATRPILYIYICVCTAEVRTPYPSRTWTREFPLLFRSSDGNALQYRNLFLSITIKTIFENAQQELS